MSAMKFYQDELARMFVDVEPAFSKVDFLAYNNFVILSSQDIPMKWALLPRDSDICHLFRFNFQ